ncbi:TetR family transcriptional regulator [Actinocrispum wychmicini]|uniref:TetR family transcriptional regulator n=1 Tax=Actinocrispum wychmicini TaxID=1213861 RepID=A0A4R2JFJ8_9PSEU|nr:TetR family transcriptional regulator [Actinocrispum wychmicini]TCO58521.1 TetR family transcriptional regulator [Actinocrispum wychmicini]
MPYDSNATKERILAAATTEFAEFGVAGARIDRIAANAEANKRAIYDYFGDKDALFAAVLERQMVQCAEVVPVNGGDMADYARRLMDYHAAHPEALRLLLWEALEFRGEQVPAEETRRAKYGKRVAAIGETGGIDPRVLMFFTLGLVNWGSAVPQLRRMILGDDHAANSLQDAVAAAVRVLQHVRITPG